MKIRLAPNGQSMKFRSLPYSSDMLNNSLISIDSLSSKLLSPRLEMLQSAGSASAEAKKDLRMHGQARPLEVAHSKLQADGE